MYTPFANYFVKYIQAYAQAGINIDYISLQNEPLYVPTKLSRNVHARRILPSTDCHARQSQTDQTTALFTYVLPALSAAGLTY